MGPLLLVLEARCSMSDYIRNATSAILAIIAISMMIDRRHVHPKDSWWFILTGVLFTVAWYLKP